MLPHAHAEEALQESENRFKAFMDHNPAVIFMKDQEVVMSTSIRSSRACYKEAWMIGRGERMMNSGRLRWRNSSD